MADYDISSITSALNSSATGQTNSTEESDSLDQDAFLELLIAQLENQDPLDPMDNTEYVSQLAQLSSLEQMQTMNENISQLIENLGIYEGSSLMGKTVEINDGEIIGEVTKISFKDEDTYVYVDGEQNNFEDITAVYSDSN